MRKGGEQPETNDQSVAKANSFRPSLSGSYLAYGEPLIARDNPMMAALGLSVAADDWCDKLQR